MKTHLARASRISGRRVAGFGSEKDERVRARVQNPRFDHVHTPRTPPHIAPPTPSPTAPTITMSEKIKEFTDIPQTFLRDGNQVRLLRAGQMSTH
jgi:hypothetical protein